jgi:tetratricopeptide (TPR) repeat protein
LERGVEDQRDRFDDRPELRSRLLRAVAEAYGGLGMDVESSGLFLEAIALLPETGTLADTFLANTFGSLGISYLDRGRYAEAYSAFQQARSLLVRAGADSLLQAGPMVGEGNALALNGQPEEAEPVHTREYGIFLREAGPDDPKTLGAQMALARSMNGLGQVDSAAALVRGVVDRARPLGDSLGSTMANALNSLGYYRRQLEDYSEAVASYREALDSYARWISPSSRLRVLQNLASAQELLGDTEGLIATLKEGVTFAEEAWPEGNWRVGQAWKVLSVAYLRYGFRVESEESLRNAVASFTQILGPVHGWAAGAESELGDLLGILGRPLEAEPLLLEGYRKLLAGSGPEHALTRAAAGRLSDFYQAQGRTAEAARYSLLSEEG